MTDVFNYPYPLEFDQSGDADKMTANFSAIVNHINNNLQSGKSFTLKYREVYAASGKFYTAGTAFFSLKMRRAGTIEAAGFRVAENPVTPPQVAGTMRITTVTGDDVATCPDFNTAATDLTPPAVVDFKVVKPSVAQGDVLYVQGSLADSAGNPINGLSVSVWVVVKTEVEV